MVHAEVVGAAGNAKRVTIPSPTRLDSLSLLSGDSNLPRPTRISIGEMSPQPEVQRPKDWWRTAVIYQVYPRSFYDSNGDGNGDLPGITQKLDFLQDLGVNGLWLNPFLRSPMNDGGYDTADYREVDPMFGTNADIKELIQQADKRGIKIIMDLVMNHTSDQHKWFQESRDPDSELRDYYVWRKGRGENGEEPPTNWSSFFDGRPGSAWTRDDVSGEWYLHKFDPSQPDLNPYNPKVWDEMKDVMRFWLDQGIGGIRFDVLSHMFHDPDFGDMDVNQNWKPGDPLVNKLLWQPKYLLDDVYPLASEFAAILDEYGAVGVPEIHAADGIDDAFLRMKKFRETGIALPFNFTSLEAAQQGFSVEGLNRAQDQYALNVPRGAGTTYVFGNHDQVHRLPDRVGHENLRLVTLMELALGGTGGSTIFMYQGDEIGMRDGGITSDNQQDPQGKHMGVELSRDNSRTMYPWGGQQNGDRRSWLPDGMTVGGEGALEQMGDPGSMLNFTKAAIRDRVQNSALGWGDYVSIDTVGKKLTAFARRASAQTVFFVGNWSDESHTIELDEGMTARLVRSTNGRQPDEIIRGGTTLEAHEGVIYELLRST